MNKTSSKTGQMAFLAALSLTMVLGFVRAPEIKTCLEADADIRATCISQIILPQIALLELQRLATGDLSNPIPPAAIPNAGPGKPLQLSPILKG